MAKVSTTNYKLPLRGYNDFRGGWNADAAPDSIADNEMAQADDLDLSVRGGFRRRKGYLRLNKESFGVQAKQTIEYCKNDGSIQLLALIGTNLALLNEETWTIEEIIQSGVTRDDIPHYFYGDKMMYLDGSEYRVYDGTESRPVYISPPETAPTITGANLTENGRFQGVYQCWVVFVQADGYMSSPSPAATINARVQTTETQYRNGVPYQVTVVKYYNTLDWSNIPIGPTGTVKRKLYRTKANSSEGRLLATIDNNTATTYTDTTADDGLSSIDVLNIFSDLTDMKKSDFLIYHPKSARVFAASKNSADVQYSETAKPEYFRSHVTPTSGDGPVVGLRLFGDALVVFYSNSAWVWRGQDPEEDAIWQKLPMPGAFSHYGIIDTPGTLTWIGPGGVYSAPPAILAYGNINVKNEEYSIVNHAEKKIQSVIENMGTKDVISAVYDANTSRIYCAYPDGKDSTQNTHILVLDWTLKAFTRYTNINAKHLLQRKNGDIIASTNGYLVKLNGAVDDPENTPVKMSFKSKPYHLDHPFHKKRILRLFTEFKAPETGNVTFTFNIYVDSILVYSRDHVSLGESFVWGESVWGDAIWGGRELIATRSKISASGHRVEVEISCDQLDVEDVIVYGFAFEFRPIRAKGARI